MTQEKTPKLGQGDERYDAVALALGIVEDLFNPPAAELFERLTDAEHYDNTVDQKHQEFALYAPWMDNALAALNPKILETAKLNQRSPELYHRDFIYEINSAVFAFAYMRGLRAAGMEPEAILKKMAVTPLAILP